jgi:porin
LLLAFYTYRKASTWICVMRRNNVYGYLLAAAVAPIAVSVQAEQKGRTFEHSVNWLSDHSVLSSAAKRPHEDEDAERQAHRLLLTYDFQFSGESPWSLSGNFKMARGNNGEALTENLQGISNIDAEHFSKLYELYLQYQLNDTTRLKCGQVDANLEFAFVPVAGGFISPPLGITPTAIALPTYYDPAMSCSVFYEPDRGFQWMGGVFAGRDHLDFAEKFYLAEGRYVTANSRSTFGYWRHNGDWEDLRDGQIKPIDGWYLNHQYQLTTDWSLIAVWSRLQDNVDVSRQHQMLGAVRQFEQHQFGVMASKVLVPEQRAEWLAEIYWQHQWLEQVQIQPVLQWVRHSEPDWGNNLVLSVRLNWTWF